MRGPAVALVTLTLALLGLLVAPSMQQFMARDAPPLPAEAPASAPSSRRWMPPARPPTVDCRTGRRNPMRPPSWSLAQEALVQAAVVNRLVEAAYDRRLSGDLEVLIADETVRPLTPPAETDVWPMNHICEQLPQLQVSTVESFRRFNRDPGAAGFRFVTSLVPVRYIGVPRTFQDWERVLSPTPGVGLLRFSHVGFSERMIQALVAVDHHVRPGYGRGFYFLLERTAEGRWRIIDVLPTWVS